MKPKTQNPKPKIFIIQKKGDLIKKKMDILVKKTGNELNDSSDIEIEDHG
jgi:hypothetical protein